MKGFYKKFFLLMIPMALKELVAAFINLLDTVMLGSSGEDVIAAVGIGNQWFFLFAVLTFGICGGAGVLASQYWGAGDIGKVKKVLGINLYLIMGLSVLFMSLSLAVPRTIIEVFRKDPGVVEEGVKYLRIVCFSYIFSGITSAYDISLCCSGKAGIPVISRTVGLFVNFVINWILIFGKLGFPAMGVRGAAIATVIARACELSIVLGFIYGKKLVQAAKLKELFSVPKGMLGGYFRAALPITLNEGAWALGTVIYSWVFSQTSKEAFVVITIVQNIERLLLVFFHGGGNAAGILIGRLVGANKADDAYNVSKKLCLMNTVFSLFVSGMFILVRPLVLIPYEVGPNIYNEAMNVLLLMALIMNVKALTFFFIVGVFRNGGDTKMAAVIDISSMWGLGVPMTIVAGLVLHLPLMGIYVMTMAEEILKLILSIPWFISRKWIKNLVSGG